MKTQLLVLISAALLAPLSGFAAYATSNSTPPLILRGADLQPKQKSADQVSPAAAEVIKLSKSKVGDDVVISYIENSPSTYNLTSENIIYLHDTGLKSQVITAMIRHDKVMYDQLAGESARAATNRPPNMDRTPEQMQPYGPGPYEQWPQEFPPQSQNYYDNGLGAAGYYYGGYGGFAPFGSWFNLCDDFFPFSNCLGEDFFRGDRDPSFFTFSHHLGDWEDVFRFRHDRRVFDRDPSFFTFSHHLGDWEDVFRFRHDRRDFDRRLRDFTFFDLRDFGARDLTPIQLNSSKVDDVSGHSTVANNFAARPQHTFVNRGNNVTRVGSMSRNPIPRANLRGAQVNATGTVGGNLPGTRSRIISTVQNGTQFRAPMAGRIMASGPPANNSGNGAVGGSGASGRR
jgi:hypothetical protein